MTHSRCCLRKAARLTALILSFVAVPVLFAQDQDPSDTRGAPNEPVDAADLRAQITIAESLLTKVPDRGAILYFLASNHALLRETLPALDQLKQCIALKEGFDPSGDPAFAALKTDPDFKQLVEQVHKDFPAVHLSKVAFTADKDLFPEGLAYDSTNDSFYLSSLYRPKISRITHEGKVEEFVPPGRDHLLPILGIRLDPTDNSIWSASSDENTNKSELLHFDRSGALLGRYAPPGGDKVKHEFNDLVILPTGALYLTDTAAHQVYQFVRKSQSFEPLHPTRQLLFPNGITLANDDQTLYIADQLGVLRLDLKSGESANVDPGPRSTLAGIDGLYFHKGSLIGVQNGIGTPRLAVFRLSPDGLHVTKTTILENFLPLPTTGAIRNDDFYFIVNSQIDNLNGQHILDVTRLEPVRISFVRLP